MLVKEAIEIIKDNSIGNKYDAMLEHFYGLRDTAIIMAALKEYGVAFDFQQKEWIIDETKVKPDANLVLHVYFGNNHRLKPLDGIEWDISKDFTNYDELISILNSIQNHSEAKYEYYFREKTLRMVAVYILEFLHHPLDALLVDEQSLDGFPYGNIKGAGPYLLALLRTTAVCLALRYKVVVPFEISSNALTKFKRQSLLQSPIGELVLVNFAHTMIMYIEDGQSLFSQVQDTIKMGKKYTRVAVNGGNFFYYVVMFLLAKGKNKWIDLNLTDLNILYVLHLYKIGEINGRNISSINLFFYLKTGVNNFIQQSKSLDELINSDEVNQLFKLYFYYLKINKRSQSRYNNGSRILRHKPENIIKVEDLTKENLVSWIGKYSDYAFKNGTKKNVYQDGVTAFLNLLLDIMTLFQQENIFGIKRAFPCNALDIGLKNRKYKFDESKVVESVYNQIKAFADKFNGEENIIKGTFKADIEYADTLVRAIYNYKFEHEKGTVGYFNELQKMTILRIIADSGVRSNEALNMPFGTHSFLKEQGVNVCVLGWSKLFDRFGVVPISSSTAKMIEECTKIRKEQFPNSLIKMPIHQAKGSKASSLEYLLQFVSIHPITGGLRRIDRSAIDKQFDKVCLKAGIKQIKGKKFHALRHRAAEYFFFCASYYEFDGKNDYEYKETIVKKLLRHTSSEMTKEYYWGELANLIAEKKLVFYKDLSDMSKYTDNPETKSEALCHMDSVIKKIRKDLCDVLSNPNIDKLVKILTLPIEYFDKEVLAEVTKNQSYKKLIDHLVRVDGNKSPVPPGAAYFGMCMNFSCPKLKEKITCVSCGDFIVTEKDVPRMIGEIIRCNSLIQIIYQNYENTTQIDHLKSLRSRVVSNMDKLQNDLEYPPLKILELMQEHVEKMVINIK